MPDLTDQAAETYLQAAEIATSEGCGPEEVIDFATWVAKQEIEGKRAGEPLLHMLRRYLFEKQEKPKWSFARQERVAKKCGSNYAPPETGGVMCVRRETLLQWAKEGVGIVAIARALDTSPEAVGRLLEAAKEQIEWLRIRI